MAVTILSFRGKTFYEAILSEICVCVLNMFHPMPL